MKVAINGFGRIGKQFLLAALEKGVAWDFVVNEIAPLDAIVYSLKYDSVQPGFKDVASFGKYIIVGDKRIKVYSEPDPLKLPWKSEKVDLVIECSGLFTDASLAFKHIKAGAKKVLISAPAKSSDSTIVCGVNTQHLKKDHNIISAGSCTTNCISILLKVLHDAFKVKNAFFITTHAYTATQKLIDSYDKKDLARGRAASENIIPSTSGASQSVIESIPELKGKLDGFALRVPVANGSIGSVFAKVNKKASVSDINKLFKKRAEGDLKGILEYTQDPIVSSDIIHNSASCIFDSRFTSVQDDIISISGWYDNEWGYSNRLVEVAQMILGK